MTGAGEGPIRIDLCGALAVTGADGLVAAEVFGGQRGRRAFAYLTAQRDRPVSRHDLAAAIWADEVPPTWASAVRSALTRVRAVCRAAGLPDDALDADGAMVRLRLPDDAQVDIEVATEQVRVAESSLAGDERSSAAIDAARRAEATLSLPLLVDMEGDWVDEQRRIAHLLRLRALDVLATGALQLGQTDPAIDAASRSIALEPLRESAYRTLMAAHRHAGRRGDALRAYERIRAVLADELGVSPSPETQAAYVALLDVPEWAADAARSKSSELPAALGPRDEMPFVGRTHELDVLTTWWATTGSRPSLAMVRGEPGIGKSRLGRELARRAHADGARVVHARFDEGRSVFQPFVDMLTGVPDGADLVERLNGTSTDGHGLATRDEVDRDILLDEIAACLVPDAQQPGLLAVFDDVQWAGEAAIDVIRRLLRREAEVHVLITARDSGLGVGGALSVLIGETISDGQLTTVAVPGLDTSAIIELLTALGGGRDDGSSRRLASEFREQSAGNPLLVGEMISHLMERGDIRVDDAGHWSGSTIAASNAPGVHGVVMARVGALGDGADEVLGVASVIGPVFELTLLGECVDGGLERAVHVVDRAITAHLVRWVADQPGCCRFVHSVVHATLLDSLSPPLRMVLHRRVGLVLDVRPRLPGRADDLARHFIEAAPLGETYRAVRCTIDAASEAIRATAYEDAIARVQRALALDIDDRSRAALLILLGHSGIQSGDSTEAHQAFLDAVQCALRADDAVLVARASLGAMRGFRAGSEWMPELERRAMGEVALARLPDDEVELRVQLLSQLALWTPEPIERRRLAHQAMTLAAADASAHVLIAAYGASRIELWRPEQTAPRLAFAEQVVASANSLGDHHLAAAVRLDCLGDLIQSADRLAVETVLAGLAKEDAVHRSRRLRWRLRLWDVVLAMVDGRLDEVEALAGAAFAEWGAEPHVDALQAYGNQVATAHFLQGRAGEIVDVMAQWMAENPQVPGFRAVLAWMLSDVGRLDEARVHVDLLRADGLAGLPQDNTFPITMVAMAHACRALNDAQLAGELYTAAGPLAGQLVFLPGPSVFVGPGDHALALLAVTKGDVSRARGHVRDAITLAQRTCGPWWVARSRALLDSLAAE